jgi:hypothetical protein
MVISSLRCPERFPVTVAHCLPFLSKERFSTSANFVFTYYKGRTNSPGMQKSDKFYSMLQAITWSHGKDGGLKGTIGRTRGKAVNV